jgi:hypothetical protein
MQHITKYKCGESGSDLTVGDRCWGGSKGCLSAHARDAARGDCHSNVN